MYPVFDHVGVMDNKESRWQLPNNLYLVSQDSGWL